MKSLGLSTLWKAINLHWSPHSLRFERLKGSAVASPTNKVKPFPRGQSLPKRKERSKERRKKPEYALLPDIFWEKRAVTGFVAINNRATELQEWQPILQDTPLGTRLLANRIWERFGHLPHLSSPGTSIPARLTHPCHQNTLVPAPTSLLNSEHPVNKKQNLLLFHLVIFNIQATNHLLVN